MAMRSVAYIVRFDVLPDKMEEYQKTLAEPRPKMTPEPRAQVLYQVHGEGQARAWVFEFPDLTTWEAWYCNQENTKWFVKLFSCLTNIKAELWLRPVFG